MTIYLWVALVVVGGHEPAHLVVIQLPAQLAPSTAICAVSPTSKAYCGGHATSG